MLNSSLTDALLTCDVISNWPEVWKTSKFKQLEESDEPFKSELNDSTDSRVLDTTYYNKIKQNKKVKYKQIYSIFK